MKLARARHAIALLGWFIVAGAPQEK